MVHYKVKQHSDLAQII